MTKSPYIKERKDLDMRGEEIVDGERTKMPYKVFEIVDPKGLYDKVKSLFSQFSGTTP